MKRFLGILMALCLLLGCVSAAHAEDVVTLHWWYRGNGEQADTELVNAKVNEMLQTYEGLENVKVVLHPFAPSDYQTQVLLGLSAGEPMDILNTVSLNLYQLVEDGTLRPMDEYLPLAAELTAELPEQMINYGKVDGVQYIICHQQQIANGRSIAIPTEYIEKGWVDGDKLYDMFRSDNFGKYTVTEMMDELEKSLLAVREGTGLDNIYLCNNNVMLPTSSGNYNPFIGYYDSVSGYSSSMAFQIDNATHTVYFNDMEPGATDAMARWAEWYDKGYVYADVMVEPQKVTTGDYLTTVSPKVPFEFSNGTGTSEYLTEFNSAAYGYPITVYQLNDNYYAPMTYAAGGDGITASCEHPEEAMKFIQCMNTERGKEIYNTIVYGIEGTHWEFNEDGKTIRTFGYDGPQGGSDYLYSAHKWIMGNTRNAYLNQACTQQTLDIIDEINYGDHTIKSALTGIVLKSEDFSIELDQVNALYKEFHDSLFNGVKGSEGWKAYYDEYIEKMHLAGLDKVLEGYQAQVDAYLGK